MGIESNEIETELRRAGRPVPAELRVRVLQWVSQEREKGAGLARLSRQLGLSPETIRKWMRERVFVPVAIERVDAGMSAMTVEDPVSGLRVTGLNLETTVELLRRMR